MMAEAPKTNPPPTPPKPSEAKAPAATSTYNASRKDQPDLRDPRGDTFLTHDEIHSLAGDIGPGELGILKLDEEGKPTGTVLRDKAIFEARSKPEEPYATVIGTPTVKFDEIVTPSGAPISKFMNPDPALWDAGMIARNPIPPPSEDSHPGPIGGGVVNQPVAR